ncbi:NADH-quinone oxidoreductase subunit H [bacterium]|nr:NADH-quinone oxidoreductase subunit H [bacterium]
MIILLILLNLILILFFPFIMLGIIKKTKAFWGGRKGVVLLQPLYDFVRLLKKQPVVSSTTSFVFKLAPVIALATSITAGLFVPTVMGFSIINIDFAFIVFAYILGLGKFFAVISAMDTGSSFEGMGASREACFTSLIEPAFFIIMASIGAVAGFYTFQSLNVFLYNADILGLCIIILAVVALMIMLLTETSRVPVDDPATHLELTMIHEVMILDNSGCDLAFLSWASAIKMVLISSIIANLVIPYNLPFGISIALYIVLLMFIAFLIGTIESAIARFRMSHVFEFVFAMSAVALVILSLITIRIYGG